MKNKRVHDILNKKVEFKSNEILPKVFHLTFKTRQDLTSTFLRFQETYESPQFRNKVFSVDEFVEWYKTTTKNGKFSYFTDWSGFNIPSTVITPFVKGKFGKLTTREKALIQKVKGKKCYIIGTFEGGKRTNAETLKHELAHAMFYLNAKYRKEVLATLKGLNLKPVFKYLKELGYHESVFLDESHAYILVDMQDLVCAGISRSKYQKTSEKLNTIFEKYSR